MTKKLTYTNKHTKYVLDSTSISKNKVWSALILLLSCVAGCLIFPTLWVGVLAMVVGIGLAAGVIVLLLFILVAVCIVFGKKTVSVEASNEK